MSAAAITLFLDFDGVLNSDRFSRHQSENVPEDQHRLFDGENLSALNYLCSSLPIAQIVVTSTYRRGRTLPELRAMLEADGFKHGARVVSATVHHGFQFAGRGGEIAAWIGEHAVARVLVLDDHHIDGLGAGQFYHVDGRTGLTLPLVDEIIRAYRSPANTPPKPS